MTRPKNLELLRVLASERPESIRETARLVDRDVRQVHRNLEELAELDLIEFERDGAESRGDRACGTMRLRSNSR